MARTKVEDDNCKLVGKSLPSYQMSAFALVFTGQGVRVNAVRLLEEMSRM